MGNALGCAGLGERLAAAARDGDAAEVRRLLAADPGLARCTATFGNLSSPLHLAATKGHHETPLMQACRSGHWEVVQTLLAFRCNVWKADGLTGRTALHAAAAGGHVRCVRLLLADAAGAGEGAGARYANRAAGGGRRRRHGAALGGAARARGLRAPAGRRAGVPGRADAALRRGAHGGHRRREHAAALRGVRRRGPLLPGARVPRRRPDGRQLQRLARRGRGPDVEVQLAGARAGAQVAAPHPQVPALGPPLPPAPLPPRRRQGLRRLAGLLRRRRRQRRRRLLRLPREILQRRRRSVRARAVPQVRDGPVHGDEGVRGAGARRHRPVPALPERHRLLQEGRRRGRRTARGRPPEHEQQQPPLRVRALPGPPRQPRGGRGGEEHMPVFRRPELRRRRVGRPGGRHSSPVLRPVHRPLRHLVLRTNGSGRTSFAGISSCTYRSFTGVVYVQTDRHAYVEAGIPFDWLCLRPGMDSPARPARPENPASGPGSGSAFRPEARR